MRMNPHTSRRAVLGGLAASPLLSAPALAAGPHLDARHLALRAALLAAHADHADARALEKEQRFGSLEHEAGLRVSRRLWTLQDKALALPAPKTMEGLAVVGLALAICAEGAALGADEGDTELTMVAVAKAIVSVTGMALPPDFMGYGDEPDFRERERAALHDRPGRMPAWAWNSEGAACA